MPGSTNTLHRVWFERAVLDDLRPDIEARLDLLGPGTGEDPYARIEGAVGAVAGALRYDAAVMDRAPGLRVIARTGIGVDRVDLDAATQRGIAACNAPGATAVSTAEHTVALILAVAKNLTRSAAALRAGEPGLYARHSAVELDGRTLGLVGYGRVARRVAAAARGLGMRVLAYDPHLRDAAFDDAAQSGSLPDLLAAADVVSLHLPLNDETRGSFGAEEFAAMRPGAVFVNTARGGLVDHAALLAALDGGRLFGAGLDVTDPEPLPPGHSLLDRPDVVVTPHVASGTHAGKRRVLLAAVAQVVQVLDGERPPHLVNPEVWGPAPQATGR